MDTESTTHRHEIYSMPKDSLSRVSPRRRRKNSLFFTKLPRHLRERIYRVAFQADGGDPIIISHNTSRVLKRLNTPILTCRQMYEETAGFAFKANTLLFLKPEMLADFLQCFTSSEASSKAQSILSVALCVDNFESGRNVKKALILLRGTCTKLETLTFMHFNCPQYDFGCVATFPVPGVFEISGFQNTEIFFCGFQRPVVPTRPLSSIPPHEWAKRIKTYSLGRAYEDARASMKRPLVYDCPRRKSDGSLLLQLPPELRNQIYTYCFQVEANVPQRWALLTPRSFENGIPSRYSVLDILLTCRQIYTEAVGVFYGENALCFRSPVDLNACLRTLVHKRTRLGRYHSRTLAIRRQSIRTVVLFKPQFPFTFSAPDEIKSLKEAMGTLLQCRSLTHLRLFQFEFPTRWPSDRYERSMRGVLSRQRGFAKVTFSGRCVCQRAMIEWPWPSDFNPSAYHNRIDLEKYRIQQAELEEIRKRMMSPRKPRPRKRAKYQIKSALTNTGEAEDQSGVSR